jgi:hypothetical protein
MTSSSPAGRKETNVEEEKNAKEKEKNKGLKITKKRQKTREVIIKRRRKKHKKMKRSRPSSSTWQLRSTTTSGLWLKFLCFLILCRSTGKIGRRFTN